MAQRYRHASAVAESLEAEYGRPRLGNKRDPFRELVYIVLSSRTVPRLYQRTYRALVRVAPRADDLATTPVSTIERAIRVGGLSKKKARQVKGIASSLRQRFGRVTLAPLREMCTPDAEQMLTSLPGVGIKTARCVLMYALDRDVFPIDVHCLRVCRRLGWTRADRVSTDVAEHVQSKIEPSQRYGLHVGMILLGRAICTPRNPSCDICPIRRFCPSGSSAASRRHRSRRPA